MQLSQHIFDLQLARHVERSTQARSSASRPPHQNRNSTRVTAQDASITNTGGNTSDRSNDTQQEASASQDRATAEIGLVQVRQPVSATQRGEPARAQEHEQKADFQESARMLFDIRETLKDVIKVLIASQNSLARGFNSSDRDYSTGYTLGAHSLINDKGEEPEMHGLPMIKTYHAYNGSPRPHGLDKKVLARYLQFYGIGGEMVDEEGESVTIKPGMEESAWNLLSQRVYICSK